MSKRDDFIAIVMRVKSVLSTITDEQRKKLLRQGVKDYELEQNDAETILIDNRLTDDQTVNYFEVLNLDINHIESLSGHEINIVIEDKYNELEKPLQKDANPRNTKKRDLLEQAKKALLHQNTRQKHIDSITSKHRTKHDDLLFTLATTSTELITLLESNTSEATEILYSGGLAKCLTGRFASAARDVVDKFSTDKSMGLMAMVAILRGKIKFKSGGEVSTRRELAHIVDKNWDEGINLLYNGFFTFWFKHTNETILELKTNTIVDKFKYKSDIGLEKFIQELHPNIGKPEPEVSRSEIDFGTMNINSEETKAFEIKNKSRGKLSGHVRIGSKVPGLRVTDSIVKGRWIVSVEMDTSTLDAHKTYNGSVLVETNGGNITIPITCNVDNLVQKSVKRIAISGLSVAAIAIVARLIVQQVVTSGWLATHLTGAGFIGWGQYWQWVEWFKWPWFEWKVYTLSGPGTGLGFVIAFALLGVGIFGYWCFFFKKKILS